MTEQKLRKFKLIDREGFLAADISNESVLKDLEIGGFLSGCTDEQGNIGSTEHYDTATTYIWKSELKFFEEVFEDEVEEMVEDKKIIKKYIREEFNTRGQALDSYDSGVVFYTPNNDGYSVVDEDGILDHFGQLFTPEEREETWQDVAQEFIKNDPVLSGDKFVEDMFGDDFTEYHEPMKQLAKLIVESSK